jgi:hypothetical protein
LTADNNTNGVDLDIEFAEGRKASRVLARMGKDTVRVAQERWEEARHGICGLEPYLTMG